jgi:hypothetical protein
MANNLTNQNAKDEPNCDKNKPQQPKATQTKSTKRKIIVLDAVGALLAAFGSIFCFYHRAPVLLSVGLLMGSVVFGALSVRLVLINYGSPHREASRYCGLLMVLGFLGCALLYRVVNEEYTTQTQQSGDSAISTPSAPDWFFVINGFRLSNATETVSLFSTTGVWKVNMGVGNNSDKTVERVMVSFWFASSWTNETQLNPEWFAEPSLVTDFSAYRDVSDSPVNIGFGCGPITLTFTNTEALATDCIPYPIGIEAIAAGTKTFRQFYFLALKHGIQPPEIWTNSPFSYNRNSN